MNGYECDHIGLYPVYKRPDISVIFVRKRQLLTYKTGLTLHDFCRAMDQIGYDTKRRVIAEDRGN